MPNHIERREYNLKIWKHFGIGGFTIDNAFREGWDCFQHDFGHQLKAKDERIEELEDIVEVMRKTEAKLRQALLKAK